MSCRRDPPSCPEKGNARHQAQPERAFRGVPEHASWRKPVFSCRSAILSSFGASPSGHHSRWPFDDAPQERGGSSMANLHGSSYEYACSAPLSRTCAIIVTTRDRRGAHFTVHSCSPAENVGCIVTSSRSADVVDRREGDGVEAILRHAVRPLAATGFHAPAVLVEDAPRRRHPHLSAARVVEPVDLDFGDRRAASRTRIRPIRVALPRAATSRSRRSSRPTRAGASPSLIGRGLLPAATSSPCSSSPRVGNGVGRAPARRCARARRSSGRGRGSPTSQYGIAMKSCSAFVTCRRGLVGRPTRRALDDLHAVQQIGAELARQRRAVGQHEVADLAVRRCRATRPRRRSARAAARRGRGPPPPARAPRRRRTGIGRSSSIVSPALPRARDAST